MKLVLIEWQDSASFDSWTAIDTLRKLLPSGCKTVGFLLEEDETYVTLVGSYASNSHNDSACGAMCIPKQCITARHDLIVA
jgi:hypothetical protein